MGCYIKIFDEKEKLDFLNNYGKKVSFDYVFKNYQNIIKEDNYPVIVVELENSATAVAILYNKNELMRSFRDCEIDNLYYIVALQDLIPVSNIMDFIKFKS